MKSKLKRFFALVFMALTSIVTTAQAQVSYSDRTEDPTFSKWDLKQLLSKTKVYSVEQLLTLLPGKMKQQAILVFQSRSLQAGSLMNPRVMLYNEDTSLVMTFNGDVSQYGYETVEVMSFNFEKNQFEFEEIVMSGDLKKRVEYLEAEKLTKEIEALKHRESRTGVNPATCLACHRQNPRPNWEPYPNWPGVFGQANHLLSSFRQYQDGTAKEPVERVKLREFLEKAQTHPRYSKLSYIYQLVANPGLVDKTNLQFTVEIAKLNFRRLAVDLICHPKHEIFKAQWEQFSKLTSDGGLEFMKPEDKQKLRDLGYSPEEFYAFMNETRVLQKASADLNIQLVNQAIYDPAFPIEGGDNFGLEQTASQFRFFLKKAMGFEIGDYEMTFKRDTYDFTNGYYAINDFLSIYRNLAPVHKCQAP